MPYGKKWTAKKKAGSATTPYPPYVRFRNYSPTVNTYRRASTSGTRSITVTHVIQNPTAITPPAAANPAAAVATNPLAAAVSRAIISKLCPRGSVMTSQLRQNQRTLVETLVGTLPQDSLQQLQEELMSPPATGSVTSPSVSPVTPAPEPTSASNNGMLASLLSQIQEQPHHQRLSQYYPIRSPHLQGPGNGRRR